MAMTRTVRVAAVQAAPAFLDREATAKKAAEAIRAAGARGAELVVLPEAFIPCYPTWVWFADALSAAPELYVRLCEQAVERGDDTIAELQQAARDAGALVACGLNERDGGSLYNTQVLIGADGEVLGYRRKLMPTAAERLVWGRGDARDVRVFDTPLGRVGALICYEHAMTALRGALIGLGEEIHVAMWPAMPREGDLASTGIVEVSMRNHAWEAQAFVVHASVWQDEAFTRSLLDALGREEAAGLARAMAAQAAGMTGVVGPTGRHLAGPAGPGEEIVVADLDPSLRLRAKYMVDGAGHYTRPDAVGIAVRDPAPPLVSRGDPEGGAGSRPRG